VQPSPTASWKDDHETGESGPPKTQAEAAYRHLRRDIRAGLLAPTMAAAHRAAGNLRLRLEPAARGALPPHGGEPGGRRGAARLSRSADSPGRFRRCAHLAQQARGRGTQGVDRAGRRCLGGRDRRRPASHPQAPPHWETTNALASEEQQRRHHMFHASLLAACPHRDGHCTSGISCSSRSSVPAHRAASRRSACGRRGGNPARHELIAEEVLARRFDQAVEALRAHNAWSTALIREALRLEPVE
jgi:hypothetical protein